MRFLYLVGAAIAYLSASQSWAETAGEFVQKGETALAAHDAATAMQSFDKALELDPDNGTAAFDRAKMLLKVGEARQAISDFTIAIVSDPRNAAALDGRGQAKMTLKEPEIKSAFEDFDLAIEANAGKPEPLLVRASYLVQFGKLAQAKADLEKARTLADEKTAASISQMLARLP